MFKQRKEVWDILCDIDNNTITLSDELLKQEQPQHTELDQKFISNLIALIDVLKMQGKTDRYIEMMLRSHFRVKNKNHKIFKNKIGIHITIM